MIVARKWIGMVTLLSLLALTLTGCATPFADSSRTGRIHDVNIEHDVIPTELTVSIGDEIRWVNHRTGLVRVYFRTIFKSSCPVSVDFAAGGTPGGFRRFLPTRLPASVFQRLESTSTT